jgi:hypothetical protein
MPCSRAVITAFTFPPFNFPRLIVVSCSRSSGIASRHLFLMARSSQIVFVSDLLAWLYLALTGMVTRPGHNRLHLSLRASRCSLRIGKVRIDFSSWSGFLETFFMESFRCHQPCDLRLSVADSDASGVPILSLASISNAISFDSNRLKSSFKKSAAICESSGLSGSICDYCWLLFLIHDQISWKFHLKILLFPLPSGFPQWISQPLRSLSKLISGSPQARKKGYVKWAILNLWDIYIIGKISDGQSGPDIKGVPIRGPSTIFKQFGTCAHAKEKAMPDGEPRTAWDETVTKNTPKWQS